MVCEFNLNKVVKKKKTQWYLRTSGGEGYWGVGILGSDNNKQIYPISNPPWCYYQNVFQILLTLSIPTTTLLIQATGICYLDRCSSLITTALLSLCEGGGDWQHRTTLLLCRGWKCGSSSPRGPVSGLSLPTALPWRPFPVSSEYSAHFQSRCLPLGHSVTTESGFLCSSCHLLRFTHVLSCSLSASFLECKFHANRDFDSQRYVQHLVQSLIGRSFLNSCLVSVREWGRSRTACWGPVLCRRWSDLHGVVVAGEAGEWWGFWEVGSHRALLCPSRVLWEKAFHLSKPQWNF